MRVRLRARPAVIVALMVLLGLLALLPLRVALGWFGVGEQGLTARRVSGSVWDGRLSDARFGELALGNLDASLSPFALLIGRARIAVSSRAQPLGGAIAVSRHVIGIDDFSATLPTGRVFAPVPVTALALDGVTVHFRDGGCEQAEGRVTATLVGAAAGIALPGAVSGSVRCDGTALLVPLASAPGTETIALRITGDGRYTASLSLGGRDPVAAQQLAAAGFVAQGDAQVLSIEGRF